MKQKKPIVGYKEGEIVLFDSLWEAGQKLNLNISNICAVLRGRRNTTGGYYFRYI